MMTGLSGPTDRSARASARSEGGVASAYLPALISSAARWTSVASSFCCCAEAGALVTMQATVSAARIGAERTAEIIAAPPEMVFEKPIAENTGTKPLLVVAAAGGKVH